jgi:hypothetical protein
MIDHDLHQSLELSRSFIVSILWEAYRREDTEQIKEFEDKLKAVDEEIDKLNINTMSTKAAHTPGPHYAVNYAGYIIMQKQPEYLSIDLLKADDVGMDVAEANGALYASAPRLAEERQELRTRLYNLKSAVDCLSGVGELGVTYTVNDAWAKVDLAMKDASETLKKLIK